jgi:hypothetical protein
MDNWPLDQYWGMTVVSAMNAQATPSADWVSGMGHSSSWLQSMAMPGYGSLAVPCAN